MAPRKKIAPLPDPTAGPVRYMKIPPFVQAYEISHTNIRDVARWADANVSSDDQGKPLVILRKMPPPYNKGYVGQVVVKDENGDRRIASRDQFFDLYVPAPEGS